VTFVHLAGSQEVIAARMALRQGHYMPLSLLDSQFATLEPPDAAEEAFSVSIDQPLQDIVAEIARRLS
jgi:gluconokinase